MDVREINRWFRNNGYEHVRCELLPQLCYGIYQLEKVPDVAEVKLGGEEVLFEFAYLHPGRRLLFDTRNQVLGFWVCEEVMRRDPRYCYREGNRFHEAFLASKKAEADRVANRKTMRELGEKQWETAKKDKDLMREVYRFMEMGRPDLAAAQFSPGNLLKRAVKDGGSRELLDRNFHRALDQES